MTQDFNNDLKTMAKKIKAQASELEIDALILFMQTADIVNKYLALQLANQPTGQTGIKILTVLIVNGGSMSPTAISKKIFRTKFAVTNQIDNLVKNGLLRRRRKNKDRRSIVVTITRKGLNLMEFYSKKGQNLHSKVIFRNLDDKEIMELTSIMHKIRSQFEPPENYKM